eukprot:14605901-Alexandrium_andersonii.AAC.1
MCWGSPPTVPEDMNIWHTTNATINMCVCFPPRVSLRNACNTLALELSYEDKVSRLATSMGLHIIHQRACKRARAL